jgi:hypothetical protein
VSVKNPRWTERRLPGFFLDWRRQWAGPSAHTLTPPDYLDEQKAFPHVVAAAWLFCPETVEYRDCIFLRERFEPDNVDTWFEHFNGAQEDVEAMVNQTELFDTFSNTDLDGHHDDLASLALAIGECWQGILAVRYPGRGVTVEVSGEDDGDEGPAVTFWSDHPGLQADSGG